MSLPEIVVYSKSFGCQRCNTVKRALDKKHVPYIVKNVDEDPAALDEVKMLGYLEVPVTVVGDVHWGGFQPTMIEKAIFAQMVAPDLFENEQAALEYLRADEAA